MTTSAERVTAAQRVAKLRKLAADPGATPSESAAASKMADRLVAKYRLTGAEVSSARSAPAESPADYGAFAAAFAKAGFKPSKQARGDLSGS